MGDKEQNNEASVDEMVATMRVAGNTLTLLLTETTVKGELASVASECIQWLTSLKKVLGERIEAANKAKELPVIPQ